MQTQTEIRRILADAGLAPNKALGQNFLIDLNLMGKLVELAEVAPDDTVLEIGPGTGSLTEELAGRCGRVVAVEIDRGLHALLAGRLADRPNVVLLHGDALAGKHELSPAMVEALGPRACLVSNLPYNVATPVVAECLLQSHAALLGQGGGLCRFDRLTFTVQREVADRMSAGPGSEVYGPLSVIVAILGKVIAGPVVPASAFWPRPAVASRILRIDFDAAAARRLAGTKELTTLLSAAFAQRRKQIGSLLRRDDCPLEAGALARAFELSGVEHRLRAEQIAPAQYLEIANALSPSVRNRDH